MDEAMAAPKTAPETALIADLSFVFPCLNEEKTLETCIRQVQESLSAGEIRYEIIVADNGSTDSSREIAERLGCRVVPVKERGYGAALRGGIEAGRGEYVMFADSDSTYLYADAARLYLAAKEHDADMSIASRMTGSIEPGAMPTLHRRLGTPVLTGLINTLFHGHLSDCNSGFRCLRKAAFETWGIRSSGMEFASELLIKALKARAVVVEISSGLRCGPQGRVAHLRTWRDGMRHLLFILSEKPRLFELSGLLGLVIATLLQTVASVMGPTLIFGTFNIFDLHSQALLLLAAVVGAQIYLFSCVLHLGSEDRKLKITTKLIHMDEGVLFFTLLSALGATFLLSGYIVVAWSLARFSNLNLAHHLLPLSHATLIPIMISIGMLGVHVLKKARQ